MMYLTYDDLNKLRENPDYDIPPEDVLRALFVNEDARPPKGISETEQAMSANTSIHHAERQDFEDSEDPLENTMQILEWWSERPSAGGAATEGRHSQWAAQDGREALLERKLLEYR